MYARLTYNNYDKTFGLSKSENSNKYYNEHNIMFETLKNTIKYPECNMVLINKIQ